MATKAHLEGNKRYLEKLDHITIRVQGGTKEKIKARAQQEGMSLNAYIVGLIEKDMRTEEDTKLQVSSFSDKSIRPCSFSKSAI